MTNNETVLRQNVADLQAQLAAANVRQAELVAELAKERAQTKKLRDDCIGALIHIREYWNGDQNEQAMSDALFHLLEFAEEKMGELIAAEATGGSDGN